MADEEWRYYRERRNYLEHGLTNYRHDNNASNTGNNSYITPHQGQFQRMDPIHRRRASVIENTFHPPHRQYLHAHDGRLPQSYNTGVTPTVSSHYRPNSDSGTFPTQTSRTCPDFYPRSYNNPVCPDRNAFHTPGFSAFSLRPIRHGFYDNTIPDQHSQRYVLRDPVAPVPFYDHQHTAQYRRSQSLPLLGHNTPYYGEIHGATNSYFMSDQSLPKQPTLMDHNIESQCQSPYTNRPSQHDHLPICDKNNTPQRIHIYHTAGSPELHCPRNSGEYNSDKNTLETFDTINEHKGESSKCMDSDEEHDHDQDDGGAEHDDGEGKGPQQSTALTGFLFGNIDKEGRLEDDVLDEESKRHLGSLTTLGIGSMVKEITKDDDYDSETNGAPSDGSSSEVTEKASDAVDYSDINEVAEEEQPEKKYKDAMASMKPPSADEDEDYDAEENQEQKKLMPPPSWIPQVKPGGQAIKSDEEDKKEEDKPLAGLLPPEMKDVNVQELFPEFRPGQVLRFSRLFKPMYTPHVWRKKKKKKPEGEDGEQKDKSEKKEGTDASGKPAEDKTAEDGKSSQLGVEGPQPMEIDSKPVELQQDEDIEYEEYCPIKLDMGYKPKPEEIAQDETELFLQAATAEDKSKSMNENETEVKLEIPDWRYGPAQLWYDMLGVDETGEGFDYGFRLKREKEEEAAAAAALAEGRELDPIKPEPSDFTDPPPPKIAKVEYPDDAFHMITQLQWEDDVIWNGEDVKTKIMSTLKQRGAAAGWLPCSSIRTAAQFDQQVNIQGKLLPQLQGYKMNEPESTSSSDQVYSLFPIENEELLYTKWEDKIIWDATEMDKIPMPNALTLDPNDENIILEMPDDRDPNDEQNEASEMAKKKEKRRSTILLGKQGIIKEDDEEEEEEDMPANKDPFNLSNDEYYNPKLANDTALKANLGITLLQHSTPAVELRQPFFPTHMGPMKLRSFHRHPLKKYSYGAMSGHNPHPVLPLLKQIKRKAKLREQERLASGGGDMFFMRTPEDLTGKDGELILAEFSEEYPPLINQVGMATKMKNYYKRKPGKDTNPPTFEWGELAYAHTSPFLGSMKPGQCVQAFENHMYRSPIYEHKVPDTDFLIIRSRQHFYIRDVNLIYTVGQQSPLYEVPGPNSKKANNFMRDFLQVFIYRLFWKSKDIPRRIKMDVIKKAFPAHSESMIRKRLKPCADFKRTGVDSNWWVIKPDFRLPTEEEMRAMVSPEQCCAYYAMIAAELKLKDAGYGEKSLFAPEADDEESVVKIDDEILAAPWNTTRAYIAAMKGRCLLGLTGVADPTGCGEGFSYVKVPNKPAQPKDEEKKDTPNKKTVTGTDADLRRLPLKDAKNLLRKFGVPENEIKKLSRWEVIDVVRTMSTEQAKAGQEGMNKFARGNRFSVAEHQERYKEECQRIFDLQNKVLGSTEVLSTDDEDTDEEDSDFDELGKNLENMLSNKKTSHQLSLEREEAERRELRKMMMESPKKKGKGDSIDSPALPPGTRKLKITRTFRNESGKLYTRTETVTKSVVIDTYVRIRQTKNEDVIKQFATLDDAQKEEMKKERRRLQEQLRRIKKNQEKDKMKDPYSKPHKEKKKKMTAPIKTNLKCGACGGVGHMRTNKECPLYAKSADETPTKTPNIKVAVTEEQEEELHKKELAEEDDDVINVEGTKVKISKALVERAEKIKRKSLVLKFPKMAVDGGKKRRRAGTVEHCDYLKERKKTSNRRRADPVVSMSSIYENVLNEMRDLPDAQPFMAPVNCKLVPDYYRVIKKPMDLQTIRDNIRNRRYLSRQSFIMDINVMVKNSAQYNGPKSVLTVTAQKMLDLCLQRMAEKEEKLMRLEKAINPLLDDNDLVALNFIFKNVVIDRMKTVENSWPFQKPVNKKFVKDYYEIIKQPMDMEMLIKHTNKQKYQRRDQFISDVELILENCVQYNGKDSPYTSTAQSIVDIAKQAISEQEDTVEQLEQSIRAAREAALDAADTDSVITGTSITGGQEGDLDVQSVNSLGAGENITIPEDSESSMKPDESLGFSGQIPSSMNESHEDYVDIEGYEDDESAKATKAVLDTSLAQDLQLSPENSDDEDHRPRTSRLSSSGSDSDADMKDVDNYYADTSGNDQSHIVPVETYDENAQDYAYAEAAAVPAHGYEDPGEDSFDASAFFKSIGQGAQDSTASNDNMQADINNDLHISESENEDEDDGFVPVDGDQSQSNFDMGEFFKPNE